jgi:DNA-binding NtrC family response regulator
MDRVSIKGAEILIVEDEPLLRKRLAAFLENEGAGVTATENIEGATNCLNDLHFDYALIDINLPDGTGIDLLRHKKVSANTSVVIMTAEGGVESAVEAMRLGASDYLRKPFDLDELPIIFKRCAQVRHTERLQEHQREEGSRVEDQFYFGKSLVVVEKQLEKIINADRRLGEGLPPVLIEGETGSGKTAIARWLHHRGPRAAQSLVEVNGSTLPENLAESELFGHERGAFTDAKNARIGLFEAADGGTLFLDELPSLSLAVQAKILTAIEDRKIRRVGGNKEIPVDVRLVTATNQDLQGLIATGVFREDLYHRLDLMRINIPPLRERGTDIIKLATHLLEDLSRRYRVKKAEISDLGARRLLAYSWPGNVRELAHELERSIVMLEDDSLDFDHLDKGLAINESHDAAILDATDWFNESFVFPEGKFKLEEAISRIIQQALKQSNNNVSAAARLLGVPRDYVRYRLSEQKK